MTDGYSMSVEENNQTLDQSICHICNNEVGNAHRCKKCRKYIHLFCGISNLDEESEGYGQETLCKSCDDTSSSGMSDNNYNLSILYLLSLFVLG